MSAELDAIFPVLAAYYASEPVNSKPRDKTAIDRSEVETDFFKQKFDLTDREIDTIRSKIDKENRLNEKFDRLEELLEFLSFEEGKYHRDRGLSEFREDGDYGFNL